jgi:hypothetical protein
MTAKSAPYPPCTVTAFWLKYQDSARCFRLVTQPPHIAGPLACTWNKSGQHNISFTTKNTSQFIETFSSRRIRHLDILNKVRIFVLN